MSKKIMALSTELGLLLILLLVACTDRPTDSPASSATPTVSVTTTQTAKINSITSPNLPVITNAGLTTPALAVTTAPPTTIMMGTTAKSDLPDPTGKILQTNDMGKTWATVYSDRPGQVTNFKIVCSKSNRCYGGNSYKYDHISQDGGKTWQMYNDASGRSDISLSCPGGDVCYRLALEDWGHYTFNVSLDNGQKWTRIEGFSQLDSSVARLSCANITFCMAYFQGDASRQKNQFAVTNDAGVSWQFYDVPPGEDLFGNFTCPAVNICYMSARNFFSGPIGSERIYGTKDGAKTWQVQSPYIKDTTVEFACPTPTYCLVVNQTNEVLTTKDGGKNWVAQKVLSADLGHFEKIVCPNTTNCLMINTPNYNLRQPDVKNLLVTHDSGATWIQQPLSFLKKNDFMTDLVCLSVTNCLVVTQIR